MSLSLNSLLDIGAQPGDSEDLRLQKRVLVAVGLLGVMVGLTWGIAYWILGERTAALIPGGYAVLTLTNLAVYFVTRRYRVFRFTQLLFFLALPFFLQLALGGFVGASAVIVSGLFAPIGALVLQNTNAARRWMLAYVVLLVASLILQPDMEISNSLEPEVVGVFFVGNIFAIATFTFIVMQYFVGQRDALQAELQGEQRKSDDLLLNILPSAVAADLKEKGSTEARHYASASVLFADLVGFTEWADEIEPTDLVATLDEIFSAFDRIAAEHEIEKVRTIGDSYMAAAGVPTESRGHASAIVAAALAIQDHVAETGRFRFRIGVSSGPLVGGVVGTSKFQYDVWGDTVNVASRMESSGEAGRVHVSDSTYRMIRDEFACEPRGELEVKGKGRMRTWFVNGRIASP